MVLFGRPPEEPKSDTAVVTPEKPQLDEPLKDAAAIDLGKDLTDDEVQRMIQEADIEDRGGVDLEEFIVIMERSSRRAASFA